MRIAVYGSTGMVGRQVMAEAVRRGHDASGYSRTSGESGRKADLSDTDTVVDVAAEHDALVIAIPPDRSGGPHGPFLEAFDRVIAARPAARLLVVVGAGSLEVDGASLVERIPQDFRAEPLTMGKVLEKFRASSGLDWTAISPAPQIQSGERTGSYKTAKDTPAGDEISSQDFAVAIVDELESPQHRGERFTVAH